MSVRRNSSVELLRVLSMLMVVGMHFFGYGDIWGELYSWPGIQGQGLSFNLLVARFWCNYGIGRVGVDVFFIISAWYLCQRPATLRSGLGRAWLLEKQSLFYSLLFLIIAVLAGVPVGADDIWASFLPTLENQYWYVTAYIQFLALWPFITTCLRALTRRQHLQLLWVSWIVWAIIPLFPRFQIPRGNLITLLLLYVLVTYIRWHAPTLLLSRKRNLLTIAICAALSALTLALLQIIASTPSRLSHFAYSLMYSLFPDTSPLIVAMALAVFGLALSHEFSSRPIDMAARVTFGVYLIHVNRFASTWIWHKTPGKILSLSTWFHTPWLIAAAIIIPLIVYTACTALDLIRQLLFRHILERTPLKWFNATYDHITNQINDQSNQRYSKRDIGI